MDRQRIGFDCGLEEMDLHGRCVRPHEDGLGLPDLEVHRVVHVSSRVARREVQGLEVVPVRLDLRSLGDGEAHGDEDLLEGGSRLADQMFVPAHHRHPDIFDDDLGQIEPICLELLRSSCRCECHPTSIRCRSDLCQCVVDGSTSGFSRLEVCNATERSLEAPERPVLRCLPGDDLVEAGKVVDSADRCRQLGDDGAEGLVVQSSHVSSRPPPWSAS